MYIPKYFQIEDKKTIYEVIEKYSFAILFSQHKGEPYATHLPLVLDQTGNVLYGHFARANEQWKDIENQQVLAVFQGAHCYISPSCFNARNAVPTWNYVTVHVNGKVELVEDRKVIFDSLYELVNKYEIPDSTYNLSNLDSSYFEEKCKGIVLFKLNITKIEAKAKLSQNQPLEIQDRIINWLESSSEIDNIQVAELMKRLRHSALRSQE